MNEDIHTVGQTAYANQTFVHPLGLMVVLFLGLCVLFLPRRWTVLPFLIMACFISSAQRVVIAGADFDFLRILIIFGIIRLIMRKEYLGFVWQSLDITIILWTLSSMFFNILRVGSYAIILNRLGVMFEVFGMYFLFRCLLRSWSDIDLIIKGCIILSIPLAFFFLIENQTRHNIFSIFGGIPEFTVIREGRLRCQGAFSHPILAGCFWASLMPIIATFWWKSYKDRVWAIFGLVCSLIIVICCASSTPIMGVLTGIIGGIFFYFRNRMRLVRWSVLLMLISLHIVMKAPVWHLISRVNAVGGSTGWHRFNLIDQTIKHFDDWWLMGCSGQKIVLWGVWAGDVTNQYILEEVTGGGGLHVFFYRLL